MDTRTQLGQPPSPDVDALLTIGELAAHTGLTPEVLRTWEARHGFPEPTRLPSGHRRYTGADVRSVRRVLGERDRGVRLEVAIAAARRCEDVEEAGSVYAVLSARHPTLASYTVTKRTLLALSWAIEDECAALANRAFLVGTFQRARFAGHSAGRWSELARTARSALMMADFDSHDDAGAPARVALPEDSPLLREWIVVCDGPRMAAVLVAWELPGQNETPDAERLYEAIWSVEGRVVRDAAEQAARLAARLGSAAAQQLRDDLEEAPPPVATSTPVATAVFNRMVAYADGTVLRARRDERRGASPGVEVHGHA